MTVKTADKETTQEEFFSPDVKNKLIEFGGIFLQGMVLAAGSLVVNGAAQKYQTSRQHKLIASESNVVDFSDRLASS